MFGNSPTMFNLIPFHPQLLKTDRTFLKLLLRPCRTKPEDKMICVVQWRWSSRFIGLEFEKSLWAQAQRAKHKVPAASGTVRTVETREGTSFRRAHVLTGVSSWRPVLVFVHASFALTRLERRRDVTCRTGFSIFWSSAPEKKHTTQRWNETRPWFRKKWPNSFYFSSGKFVFIGENIDLKSSKNTWI